MECASPRSFFLSSEKAAVFSKTVLAILRQLPDDFHRKMAGVVAQLVERLVRNEEVRGSTPLGSTSLRLKRSEERRLPRRSASAKAGLKPMTLRYAPSLRLGKPANKILHTMKSPLKNKWVLITGASSGFGAAAARAFGAEGAKLLLGARRVDRLKKVAGESKKAGAGEAHFHFLDVAKTASVEEFVLWAKEISPKSKVAKSKIFTFWSTTPAARTVLTPWPRARTTIGRR